MPKESNSLASVPELSSAETDALLIRFQQCKAGEIVETELEAAVERYVAVLASQNAAA